MNKALDTQDCFFDEGAETKQLLQLYGICRLVARRFRRSTAYISGSLQRLFCFSSKQDVPEKKPSNKMLTLGIWCGYHLEMMPAQGIDRFTVLFLDALLREFPTLKVEIWVNRINRMYVESYLFTCRYPDRITYHFDPLPNETILALVKRWLRTHVVPMTWWLALRKFALKYPAILPVPITPDSMPPQMPPHLMPTHEDSLVRSANLLSEADLFWIPHLVPPCNAVFLKKPKVTTVYDFFTYEFFDEFQACYPEIKTDNDRFFQAVNLFPGSLYFVFHSDHIRQQGERYLGDTSRFSEAIYLPVLLDDRTNECAIDEVSFRAKYGIVGDYIVYPTQYRPHKNFDVLFLAFVELRKSRPDLRLVLTCQNVDDVRQFTCYEESGLGDAVLFIGPVEEEHLTALYRYANLSVAPSLAEGGFPAPALEAATVGTPFVLARIPVAEERLRLVGIEPEESGIAFFDPHDPLDFAAKMEFVLESPQRGVLKKTVYDAITSRSWSDLAREYLAFFKRVLEKPTPSESVAHSP